MVGVVAEHGTERARAVTTDRRGVVRHQHDVCPRVERGQHLERLRRARPRARCTPRRTPRRARSQPRARYAHGRVVRGAVVERSDFARLREERAIPVRPTRSMQPTQLSFESLQAKQQAIPVGREVTHDLAHCTPQHCSIPEQLVE